MLVNVARSTACTTRHARPDLAHGVPSLLCRDTLPRRVSPVKAGLYHIEGIRPQSGTDATTRWLQGPERHTAAGQLAAANLRVPAGPVGRQPTRHRALL